MSLILVPVVEIFFENKEISIPTGNRWDNAKEWKLYEQQCQLAAGIISPIKSFHPINYLYHISELSDEAIKFLVNKELKEIAEDEEMTLDNLSSLYGGFVLQENGKNLLFPQCCGTIKDIQNWKLALTGEIQEFWIGHPMPQLTQTETTITFDFEEPNPPFIRTTFTIQKEALKIAIKEVEIELILFEQRINRLYPNMEIENLGQYLLYN